MALCIVPSSTKANDFSWLVSKDENTSEMTLTDEAIDLISKEINFNGRVSFGSLDDHVQDVMISQIESNANSILKLYNGDEKPQVMKHLKEEKKLYIFTIIK